MANIKRFTTLKVQLYPNEAQEELFEKTFGCCRYIEPDAGGSIEVLRRDGSAFHSHPGQVQKRSPLPAGSR